MTIKVGEVVAVNGVRVTLRIDDDSSKETLFFAGEKYKGVSIREYISVQRGFRDIVCIIEGEHLDERKFEQEQGKPRYIRKVDARPIGYFEDDEFFEGIKFLPMIKDPAFLVPEHKIATVYGSRAGGFVIGRMLKEDIPVSLPWQRLFNSHIGIFGNTGSGKSNTLAKLYTVLFDEKRTAIGEKSKFVILDFNGEYVGEQLVPEAYKSSLQLSTQRDGEGRFSLPGAEFWNLETLSILFQATSNTQRPFLNRIINGRKRFGGTLDLLSKYFRSTFRLVFTAASARPEALDLLRFVARLVAEEDLERMLKQISWYGKGSKFVGFGTYFDADGTAYNNVFQDIVERVTLAGIDQFDELVIRAHIQLIRDLIYGYVQFEHIQPLLKRMEASLASLKKVLAIEDEPSPSKMLTVISFRKCNQEMKKVLPLLIAKRFYHQHKDEVGNPTDKTIHLIVDEAHNILSQQSAREHESWKDYRLELFEEIIKEGRKFGMFITLASQRPADISPTIVSQVHNFFIHRLVNDRDLLMLENTITTLDNFSRSLIPNLAKGCCVVTGTSFDLPMVLQVDRLEKSRQPDSDDVDLEALWAN